MKAREAFEIGARHQLEHPCIELGPCTSYSLANDPKHMAFVLSRYKFVAKMLVGKKRVLEIGCGDGFGLPIVAQHVNNIECIDWDPVYIDSINKRLIYPGWVKNVSARVLDINNTLLPTNTYDAAYMIDVLEHFDVDIEDTLMSNIVNSIIPHGTLIVGTPNKEASHLASKVSDVQHINMKTAEELKLMMNKYCSGVIMFGMNDDVLHTGYFPMCHYLWAIGSVKLNTDWVPQ
jgi:2-polyprenyl-3-methyl-5-hydroxy-6-metoxy-1,4-benzoquinol methylase